MTTTEITFTRAGAGIPVEVTEGQVITLTGSGCVLRILQGQFDVVVPTPYTAEADCTIRPDCDNYAGTPIAATLTITAPA